MKATASMGPQGFRTTIRTGQTRTHTLVADEPAGKGDDAGPTPIEMLAGALASCVTLTLRSYANVKQIPIEGVDVEVEIIRRKPTELRDGERTMLVRKHVTIHGRDISDEQRERMLLVVEKCPVQRALLEGVELQAATAPIA